MSDKGIPEKFSLPFLDTNGVPNVDHILKMDPWKEIAQLEKGQAGCTRNILDELKNVKREPEEDGADLNATRDLLPVKCERTSTPVRTRRSAIPQSRRHTARNTRKRSENEKDTDTTRKGKVTFDLIDMPKKGRNLKREMDSLRKAQTNDADIKQNVKRNTRSSTIKPPQTSTTGETKKKSASKLKTPVENKDSTGINRGSKTATVSNEKPNPISTQLQQENGIATTTAIVTKRTYAKKKNAGKETNGESEMSSKRKNTTQSNKLQSQTSTQKKNVSENSSSEEKKRVAKALAAKDSKNYSISTRRAGSKRLSSAELSSAKHPNNNKVTAERKVQKESTVSVNQKKGIEVKAKKLEPRATQGVPSRLTTTPATQKHSRNLGDRSKLEKKEATGVKNVGRFEKKLLEREEKRKKKRVERHERKVGRIIKIFSRQVIKIINQMGRPEEDESSSDSDSSFSSSFGESSYSTSSSWYSCSCSSCNQSCSESCSTQESACTTCDSDCPYCASAISTDSAKNSLDCTVFTSSSNTPVDSKCPRCCN